MTCTLPQLQDLLKGEGLRYYLIPDQEGVMLIMNGEARYQFRILIEEEGQFLQFRSDGYLYCPKDDPNLEATLRVLGDSNYRMRLMKFGWDPTDGEIAGYADIWLMDAELTQGQFGRMADAFMAILDGTYSDFKRAIETGVLPDGSDPGSEDDEDQETIDSL